VEGKIQINASEVSFQTAILMVDANKWNHQNPLPENSVENRSHKDRVIDLLSVNNA
jgi:hypothetical protein